MSAGLTPARLWRSAHWRVKERLDAAAYRRTGRRFYEDGSWKRTTWLGRPVFKNPLDLWVMQELVVDTRPQLIVEAGTFQGGSAFYFATLLDLLGDGDVVSIDLRDVNSEYVYPEHPRISYLGGRSSTDPGVVAEVAARAAGRRTMVVLDSDHSRDHVLAELAVYAPLVSPGCYLVVEDSNIGEIRPELMPGPLQAIVEFLTQTDAFEVDHSREKHHITFNPSGYLRRVTSADDGSGRVGADAG